MTASPHSLFKFPDRQVAKDTFFGGIEELAQHRLQLILLPN